MAWVSLASIFVVSFVAMEWVAWFMHRYVMHGFLWVLHRDHHRREGKGFQRNDAFFVIFAVPSWLCIMLGSMHGAFSAVAIGAGIAGYGLAYFLVHEVFIHRRLKFWKKTQSVYWVAVRKAHLVHHRHLTQENGECFGLLWVKLSYIAEARKFLQKGQAA